MPEKYIGKATVGFRVDCKLIESFTSLTKNQFGHGGISKVLEMLVKSYVEKYDGVKNGIKLPSPPLMDEFESSLKQFIKTLDIEINRSPTKDQDVFDGPLQYFINNLEDAVTYAKALRAMRFFNNYDYESQLKTKLTIQEAYNMIINEKIEQYFRERITRLK